MAFSILFLIGRLKKMAWKWGVGGLRRLKIAWYSFCTASSALLLLLTTDFYLAVLILLPQCLRSHISGICFHYVIKRKLIYLTSLCTYRDQLVFTSGTTNTLFWLGMLRNNAFPYSTVHMLCKTKMDPKFKRCQLNWPASVFRLSNNHIVLVWSNRLPP